MKRYIYLILISIVAHTNAFAQWTTTHLTADPLRDMPAQFISTFTTEDGVRFICSSIDDNVTIHSNDKIFNYDIKQNVHVIIGFYIGNNLVERKDAWFYVPASDPTYAISGLHKKSKIGKKIKEHLRAKGSVRIIVDVFGDSNIELIIPMKKNLL